MGNLLLQFSESRVHCGLLTWACLSVRMMPQVHMDTTDKRKDSMKTASFAGLRRGYSRDVKATAFFSHQQNEKARRPPAFNRGMLVLCSVLALVLAGCTSESNKPEEPAKPETKGSELITARSAFQKLYLAARGWSHAK